MHTFIFIFFKDKRWVGASVNATFTRRHRRDHPYLRLPLPPPSPPRRP
jgi:hypothetical protein